MQDNPVKRYLDRRIKSRHPADTLSVRAIPAKFFKWFKRPLALTCVDFNRYGMAVECKKLLRKGDRLLFSFRGRYIYENDIEGEVTSITRSGDVYRYGVVFSYTESPKRYSREVDNALSRIEGIYRQMGGRSGEH